MMAITIVHDPSTEFRSFEVICKKFGCTIDVGELEDVKKRHITGGDGTEDFDTLHIECRKCKNVVEVPPNMEGYSKLLELVLARGEWR
jgi:hypothetical protein